MNSSNTSYVTSYQVFKRLVNPSKTTVTGWRLDPTKDGDVLTNFILMPFDRKIENFEDDILEIYTEREWEIFKRKNRYLIESGLVKDYTESLSEIDETNILTDEQVEAIALSSTTAKLKKNLEALTSAVTISRILDTAKDIGRPAKFLQIIQDRIDELKEA